MTFEMFKWATAVFSLLGVWLNIHRDRRCFAVWFATNMAWTAVDAYYGIWPQAVLQGVYVGLAVYGLWKWRADVKTVDKEKPYQA